MFVETLDTVRGSQIHPPSSLCHNSSTYYSTVPFCKVSWTTASSISLGCAWYCVGVREKKAKKRETPRQRTEKTHPKKKTQPTQSNPFGLLVQRWKEEAFLCCRMHSPSHDMICGASLLLLFLCRDTACLSPRLPPSPVPIDRGFRNSFHASPVTSSSPLTARPRSTLLYYSYTHTSTTLARMKGGNDAFIPLLPLPNSCRW